MKVFINFIAIIFALFVSGVSAQNPDWSNLKVTFGFNPFNTFQSLPRTLADKYSNKWKSISDSDCSNGGVFNGYRYIKGSDPSIALIFDVNGIISGLQMNMLKSELLTPGNNYHFDNVTMFQSTTINGQEFYTLTAYFVDPQTICTVGRSGDDLKTQGTGTSLYFQDGDSPYDLITAPLVRQQAYSEGWTKNRCFVGMGKHNFYQVDKFEESECLSVRPVFLLYSRNDDLHGFGFLASGNAQSSRFEHPPTSAIKAILGAPVPQCVLDVANKIKLTSMHVYFINSPRTILCL